MQKNCSRPTREISLDFSGSKPIIGRSITFNPEKLNLVGLEQFFNILYVHLKVELANSFGGTLKSIRWPWNWPWTLTGYLSTTLIQKMVWSNSLNSKLLILTWQKISVLALHTASLQLGVRLPVNSRKVDQKSIFFKNFWKQQKYLDLMSRKKISTAWANEIDAHFLTKVVCNTCMLNFWFQQLESNLSDEK